MAEIPSLCVCPAARVSTVQAYSPRMVLIVQDNVECNQHPALTCHLISKYKLIIYTKMQHQLAQLHHIYMHTLCLKKTHQL